MAGNQFNADLNLGIKAPEVVNLEKKLDNIFKIIDSLPEASNSSNKAIQEIVNSIKAIKAAIADTGSLKGVINEVKILGASLKSIASLDKGIELFSNRDIENINKATTGLNQAAKAYESLQRQAAVKAGTFGLDETKIVGVTKKISSLQKELNGLTQANAPKGVFLTHEVYEYASAIERNIEQLQKRRIEIQKTIDLQNSDKAYIAQQNKIDAQFYKGQTASGKAATVRSDFQASPTGQSAAINKSLIANNQDKLLADSGSVGLANSRALLSLESQKLRVLMEENGLTRQNLGMSAERRLIAIQIAEKEKQLTEELSRGNGETAKSVQLSREIQRLQSTSAIRKTQEANADPYLKQAKDQQRIDALLSRTEGAGGAALLKVQATLQANNAIIGSITGSTRAAVSNSIELEASLKNVQAVTNTSSAEMLGLSDNIKLVASNSKFSAVEVSDAALILGQAGLSAKQVAEALPSVINLATAAGTTLANAVDLVTSIVGVFDKSTGDTVDIANKVTAASNNSKISVEKLGLAFQYVGNAASQTGVTFEETTAALSAMSNAGITSGSTLGTGFRQFLTELQKPSEEFILSLKRIGLNISDIDIRSHGLVNVITTLRQAGFVATDAIKSFDVRSAAAFNGLIANPEALATQLDYLNNTQAAVAATAIQMDSLSSQTKRLTTSFQVAVAAGFAPTQELLKKLASSAADFFGYLAQHESVLTFLITSFETLIAVKVGTYFLGIAQGFLTLTSRAAPLITSLLAVTAAEEGAAVASLGLGGVLAGVVTGLATFAAGIASSVAGVGVFETVLLVAGNAARGLWAILLANPVGLVIAAVTAAVAIYATWESGTAKLKREQDELTGALNTAKGAYDDTQRNIELVTKKIDDLIYRQNDLDGAGKNLKPTIAEVNSQFGNLGLSVDSNTRSFSELISKLRTLKGELQNVALGKLDIEISKGRELLASQVNGLSNSIGNSQGGGIANKFENYAKTSGILGSKSISPSEKQGITDAIKTLRDSTKEDFLTNDPGGKNLQALLGVQNGINILVKYADPKTSSQLNDAKKAAEEIVAKAYDVTGTRGKVAGFEGDRTTALATNRFSNATIFNGKTFQEALPSNRSIGAEAEKALPNGSSYDLFPIVREKIVTDIDKIEGLKKTLRDQIKTDPDNTAIYEKAINDAKGRQEELAGQGKRFFGTVSEQYKVALEGQAKILDSEARNPKLSQAAKASLIEQAGQKRAEFLRLGAFGIDDTAEAKAKIAQQLADQRAQNVADRKPRGLDKIPKEEESAAAALAKITSQELERKAKNFKVAAETSTTIEDVDKNIQSAVDALTQSKAQKVEELIHEQNAKVLPKDRTPVIKREFAEAIEEAKIKGQDEIKAFVDSSVAVYAAVYKKSTALRLSGDIANIATTKEKGETALFDRSRPLAQTAIDVAAQRTAPDSTLQKVQELAVTKQSIINLTDEIAAYTQYIDDLNAALKQAQDGIVQHKLDIENAKNDVDKTRARTLLALDEKNEKESSTNLKGAISSRQSAQKNLDNNSVTAAGQEANLPLDFSVDGITKKLTTVGDLYAQKVRDFDTVGQIGTGIQGTLEGLAGGFGTMFSNIASGSMTAAQAFKAFAANVIKSMIDIITQALVMQAFKGILSAFGFNIGGTGTASSIGTVGSTGSGYSAGASDLLSLASTGHNGGLVTTMGGGSIITAARGGLLTGGITGKDSIPAMVMPGEFIMKKTAVDAVGADTLHAMNSGSAALVSNSSGMATNSDKKAPGMLNIWVVTPDQQQSMGPNDVLVTVADSLNQGNSTIKSLVKQIALGQM